MLTATQNTQLRTLLNPWRDAGDRIGLVPTMGNLHAGHLSLIDRCMALADRTVVSIFVNPTQFVSGEDLESYPRTLQTDRQALEELGVDLLYLPDVAALYPLGTEDQTRVEVPALDGILCGAFRPGHFTGVATVVTKLFNLVQPHLAVFGDKDYQQLLVIRRLVLELFLPIEIHAAPTLREADGLAMSSRNSYLTDDQRDTAARLFAVLSRAGEMATAGECGPEQVQALGMRELAAQGFRPEYFELRRQSDLGVPDGADCDLVILAAAWLGGTRLVDHIAVRRSIR